MSFRQNRFQPLALVNLCQGVRAMGRCENEKWDWALIFTFLYCWSPHFYLKQMAALFWTPACVDANETSQTARRPRKGLKQQSVMKHSYQRYFWLCLVLTAPFSAFSYRTLTHMFFYATWYSTVNLSSLSRNALRWQKCESHTVCFAAYTG